MFRHSLRARAYILPAVLIITLLFARPASAQSSGPVYIVQPNDTLYSIASRFNVSINELMAANNITDPNLLGVGQQLVIPGMPVANRSNNRQSQGAFIEVPASLCSTYSTASSPDGVFGDLRNFMSRTSGD